MSKEMIKVLVVDDSAVVRQTLTAILNSDPMIEVSGSASDPYIAANKIGQQVPDVITLDIEMPRMDGLTFLKKLMTQHPIPVVIISSLTDEGTATSLRALEYGAVDIITKPKVTSREFFEESKMRITDVIKAAAKAKVKRAKKPAPEAIQVQPRYTADAVIPRIRTKSMLKTTEKVIAVGASTGGTEAIKDFLMDMPPDSPGIVIVQHMPEHFTRSFANRMNEICKITVKEAQENDSVIRGQALIAQGNKHMLLKRSGARYYIHITDGELVNRHRPSVDVLFRSVAQYAGENAIGIIMTGMGNDGASGLLEMKETGADTVAQDEQSCVVFGMPNEAIKLGAVNKILPLDKISHYILSHA